jgi:hypothetical protein
MPEITRESHYVPQATLRRWSDDDAHVWAYRLLVSHQNVPEWKRYSIREITKQRDLYTTVEDGQEGDDFEKFVTRSIEEPGQEAIEKLIGNARMKPTDWHSIAKFVAAQQLRTPLFFIEWVRALNDHVPDALESAFREFSERRSTEPTEATEASDDANYFREKICVTVDSTPDSEGRAWVQAQVSSSRTAWLRFMRHILTERADAWFCRHRWRALRLAGGAEWPLTDNPVLALNYYGQGRYDFKAGWGQERANFILPVSPQIAVFTQIGSRETGPWDATPQQTTELQRFVIERAMRWIIVRRPASFIAQWRPRVVDAEAYAVEQESWRTWNTMHLDSEADFDSK